MIDESKKWLIPTAIILGAIILTAGLIWSYSAFSYKIATIDLQEIEVKSEFSKKLNEEVQAKGKELSSKFKSAKTDQEKQAINAEFESFKNKKQREFTSKVKNALEKVAKKHGYKGVASNQVYLYSAFDITGDVIKEVDQ
jgi:Skp family chaperone for outer membrane proteins